MTTAPQLPPLPELPPASPHMVIWRSDCPLHLAAKYAADYGDTIWERHQWAIMRLMGFDPATYWELTVGDFVDICVTLGIEVD